MNITIERVVRSIVPALVAVYVAGTWTRYQCTRLDRWLSQWAAPPTWTQPVCIESIAPVDPAAWRVADLKELLALRGIQTPRKARKQELMALALS